MNYEGHEVEHQTSEGKTGDLKLRFSQLVADIKKAAPEDWYKIVNNYQDLFLEIFGANIEKLAIHDGEFYFAFNDQVLTNFGAVVLNVTHIHEIDRMQYDLELLILSRREKAKIINVNSLSLKSGLWIEKIDASFWYNRILSIQKAVKIMVEFAPSTKVYNYSGWAIDKSDTYILGGQEICAKN